MKTAAVYLCLLGLVAGAAALSADTEANPIRKIVTLLQDMSTEIAAEAEKEQELYDKYMCYCETTSADLAKAAEGSKAKSEELSARLSEETAEKTSLDQELAEHKADRESAKKDLAEATSIRGKEAATFAAEDASQQANLDALSGALPALEKGMGASSLMQLPGNPAVALKKVVQSAPSLSQYDRNAVMSFLEQEGDYAPQSGQIVGILKQMNDEMEASLKEGQAEEASTAAAFEDLKGSKNAEVAAASSAIESKTERAGQLAVSKVQSANALEDADAETAETEKYAAALKVSCAAQTKAWGARKAGRAEEVAAISEAIGVLNDDDALDIFKKAVPSAAAMTQLGFLQAKQSQATKYQRAQAILTGVAKTYKNANLELLAFSASKMLKRAGKKGQAPGGLGMMDSMIDNMIALLTKEGEDDEKQKTWCDSELAKSADDKKQATEEGEALDSNIGEQKDGIKALGDDIETLTLQIKAMDGSVAQATEQRKEEHAECTKNQALDQAAVQLLEKATNRLNKFYNPVLYVAPEKKELSMEDKLYTNAGRSEFASPSLVQIHAHKKVAPPPPPATFDAYSKKTEKSTGVVALMGMMTNELKADSKAAEQEEADAQKEYEELMADSAETRAQNVRSITDKEGSKAALEAKFMESKKAKALNGKDLYNINSVINDFHQSCDFIANNFDLRKEARTNEAESLKNAKAVLHGMGR